MTWRRHGNHAGASEDLEEALSGGIYGTLAALGIAVMKDNETSIMKSSTVVIVQQDFSSTLAASWRWAQQRGYRFNLKAMVHAEPQPTGQKQAGDGGCYGLEIFNTRGLLYSATGVGPQGQGTSSAPKEVRQNLALEHPRLSRPSVRRQRPNRMDDIREFPEVCDVHSSQVAIVDAARGSTRTVYPLKCRAAPSGGAHRFPLSWDDPW